MGSTFVTRRKSKQVNKMMGAGLPTDRFIFEGFLPPKKGRKRRLKNLKEETGTIVIYENNNNFFYLKTQLGEKIWQIC